MSSKYTLATLPSPNNPKVNIREISASKVAVKRFSFIITESSFQKQEQNLREQLKKDKEIVIGTTRYARYNPPWTIPFLLRNEVMIEIK